MTAPDSKAGPLAYGIETFAKAAGVGRDAIYGAIREGRLTARKVGVRTIILREDGEAWLRSLPACLPKQMAAPETLASGAERRSMTSERMRKPRRVHLHC